MFLFHNVIQFENMIRNKMCSFPFLLSLILLNQTVINGQEHFTCIQPNEAESNDCDQNLAQNYFCSLNQEQQTWLQSLWQETLQNNSKPIRKRREIRMLSDTERLAYFNAVNELKNDKAIKPNKFDTLALIHSNQLLCSAHKGSNFLGWHRIYLLLFETAVRQKDPSVVLPYWNSILDNHNITDWTKTVMFSDQFYGNGNGSIVSGPFKRWRGIDNCPLWRNVSRETTELPSPSIINTIENDIKVHHVADVIDHIDKHEIQMNTIEGQHNIPHDWVGGNMNDLNSSSRDPIFFSHHAFIDYVWEKFREKQMRLGENPEYYPAFGKISNNKDNKYNLTAFHSANRTMDCFSWMTNKDGYLNGYVGILYQYEDSPTCPDCGHSKYLYCSSELKRCIGSVPSTQVQLEVESAGISRMTIILLISIAAALIVVVVIICVIVKRRRYAREENEITGNIDSTQTHENPAYS